MTWGLIVLGLTTVSVVLSDVTAADPFVTIANYGLLGVIAMAFFTGRVVSAKQYEQAVADKDREHGELVALRSRMDEQVVPALTRVVDLIGRLSDNRRIG